VAERRDAGAHETHDLELVARAAAGHLAAGEVIRARDLLSSCEACSMVASDVRAIAAATRELGSATSRLAPAPAPRDFRLTDADAARLRRRGFLGLGRFVAADPGRSRAFGGALAALGLVGLLVSTGMPSLLAGAGGSAASDTIGGAAAPAPASLPKATGSVAAELAPAATAAGDLAAGSGPAREAAPPQSQVVSTSSGSVILAIGSAAVLLAGISLLLASRSGRRAGP